MKNSKYQVMEMFFYLLIVIAGVLMLLFGGDRDAKPDADRTSPPAQVSVIPEGRSEP